MPIKPLKPSSNDELIAHIKESLSGYEEAYTPGAWENFNKKKEKKRGLVFWIGGLSSAAALLLIGFGLFMNRDTIDALNPVEQYSKGSQKKTFPYPEGAATTDNFDKDEDRVTKNDPADVRVPFENSIVMKSQEEETIIAAQETVVATTKSNITSPAAQNATAITTKEPKGTSVERKGITLEELLANENKQEKTITNAVIKSGVDKWDLGVVIAPSFGNTKQLNMGYGMSMAYKVSDRVSLSSGVSYNELAAEKDLVSGRESAYSDAPASNSAFVTESKNLQSVSARYSGIDIPLEIRYKLSERIYANIGVSAFAVINRQQENTYLQGRVEQRQVATMNGDQQLQSVLVTENVTENSPAAEQGSNKLIGFYNFSFGYRQKISKGKFVGVEPFMKVPMRDVTKESLRLLGTGLKIKFDF